MNKVDNGLASSVLSVVKCFFCLKLRYNSIYCQILIDLILQWVLLYKSWLPQCNVFTNHKMTWRLRWHYNSNSLLKRLPCVYKEVTITLYVKINQYRILVSSFFLSRSLSFFSPSFHYSSSLYLSAYFLWFLIVKQSSRSLLTFFYLIFFFFLSVHLVLVLQISHVGLDSGLIQL